MNSRRQVRIGSRLIGGSSPVAVQSMTTTDTKDVDATVAQIEELEKAGCEIVRVALYDRECAKAAQQIRERIRLPLVGDVHFDWRIAVDAIEKGIDKIRINPGNIGARENVRRVAQAARSHGIPVRVGANSGSASGNWGTGSGALVRGTLENVRQFEEAGLEDLVISVKSSSVRECVEAARVLAAKVPYPLHLGVTEAGTYPHALVKSAAGIGTLLLEDIGDTIRISISGDPVREVRAARELLACLGLGRRKLEIISCPTCARCGIDVEGLALRVEELEDLCEYPVRVAVMGCVVNGPGEAKRADLGIAGSGGKAVLFSHGRVIRSCSAEEAFAQLREALVKFQKEQRRKGAPEGR